MAIKLWIVDDDPTIVGSLDFLCWREGCPVHVAQAFQGAA